MRDRGGAMCFDTKMEVIHLESREIGLVITASYIRKKTLKAGKFDGRVSWVANNNIFIRENGGQIDYTPIFEKQYAKLEQAIRDYKIPYDEDICPEYKERSLYDIERSRNVWMEKEFSQLRSYDVERASVYGETVDKKRLHDLYIEKYRQIKNYMNFKNLERVFFKEDKMFHHKPDGISFEVTLNDMYTLDKMACDLYRKACRN